MTNLKFKKGDILVTTQTGFQPHQQEVTVLETNPSKTQSAYRTSDEPNYWWHRDTVEDNYALKEGVPKFKAGDIIQRKHDSNIRRVIVEVFNGTHYIVKRYNADMTTPSYEKFDLSVEYTDARYTLFDKTKTLDYLIKDAREKKARLKRVQSEYTNIQSKLELATEQFDTAQREVNKLIQSKINDAEE